MCIFLLARLCTQYEASCPNTRRDLAVSVAEAGAFGLIMEIFDVPQFSSLAKQWDVVPFLNFVQDVALMRFEEVECLRVPQLRNLCVLLCFGTQSGFVI